MQKAEMTRVDAADTSRLAHVADAAVASVCSRLLDKSSLIKANMTSISYHCC